MALHGTVRGRAIGVRLHLSRSATPQPKRLAGIEVLRAVCVTMILFQHVVGLFPETAAWWLPGGWLAHLNFSVGVDIFFCVSGFVVTRTLRRELAGVAFRPALWRVLRFWGRRAFRLWPTAWLWLLLALLASMLFNRLGLMNTDADVRFMVPAIAMYADFYMIDVVVRGVVRPTMSHYWSLSLEEQFYAVLPLLLVVSARATPFVLVAFCVWWLNAGIGFWTWIMIRPVGLVAGVLLAYMEDGAAWRAVGKIVRPISGWMWATGCIALCLAASWLNGISLWATLFGVLLYRWQPLLLVIPYGVLVACAAQSTAPPSGRIGAVLMWLGSRSYVIYVVHPLAFLINREIMFRVAPPLSGGLRVASFLLLAGALLFASSELTARFVERPLRLLGRRLMAEGEKTVQVDAARHAATG